MSLDARAPALRAGREPVAAGAGGFQPACLLAPRTETGGACGVALVELRLEPFGTASSSMVPLEAYTGARERFFRALGGGRR